MSTNSKTNIYLVQPIERRGSDMPSLSARLQADRERRQVEKIVEEDLDGGRVTSASAFIHPDGTISIQGISIRVYGREVVINEGQLLVLDKGKWRAATVREDYAEEIAEANQ